MIKKFIRDERGQGMTEYILIVALISVAAIVAFKYFGSNIRGLFSSAADKIQTEGNSGLTNANRN